MSSRCGCHDDAVVVEAGRGIHVDETVEQGVTTYTVSWDGQVIAGNGLLWDPETGRLHVKLRATDPGLAFDGTGALYNTRDGEPSPDPIDGPGATVAALEERQAQQDVVAGVAGAGYLIKPYNTRASVEYGAQRGFDALHLQIRFLRDGTPVISSTETVPNPGLESEQVQHQEINYWRLLQTHPGVWHPGGGEDDDPNNDPHEGWFGYLERNEVGLLHLAEAFEIVRTSCVLLLELQFPAFNQGEMTWTNPTPNDRVDRFLERVLVLIQRYGLQQSVVVLTNTPQVPNGTGEGRPVLPTFTNAGIRAGAILLSEQDTERYPAADWPPEWSWAVLGKDLPDATVTAYTDQDIHTLLTTVNRQHEHEARTVPTGALGVLSGDPEYYAGQFEAHPTASGYAYRKDAATWIRGVIDNGVLPFDDQDLTKINPDHRGHLWRHQNAWRLPPETHQSPNGGPYYVLQGWLCPIPYESYTLDFQIDPTTLESATNSYAALAICLNTDHPYDGLRNSPPDQSGYVVTYSAGRVLRIYSYDPETDALVRRAELDAQGSTDFNKRFHIVISPEDFRVRFVDQTTEAVLAQYPPDGEPAPEWALQWRGGYVFAGQRADAAPERAVALYELQLKNTVGADGLSTEGL